MQIWVHTCAHLHTQYKYTPAHRSMHAHTRAHANTPKHNACMWTYSCSTYINTSKRAFCPFIYLVDEFLACLSFSGKSIIF